jgi:hypothetical protein
MPTYHIEDFFKTGEKAYRISFVDGRKKCSAYILFAKFSQKEKVFHEFRYNFSKGFAPLCISRTITYISG